MRKIFDILMLCIMAVAINACSAEGDGPLPDNTAGDGDSILIDISSSSLPITRATVDATGAEIAVTHIDVLIFNDDADKSIKHYERVASSFSRSGKCKLAVKKNHFDANANYWVYLIANSTHTAEDFNAVASLLDLQQMSQTDRNIHITGLDNSQFAPKTFLMDGVAYSSEASEPANASTVMLYNGVNSGDTQLKCTLRRAAAKIIVQINKGDKVTFDTNPLSHEAAYYLVNMPYDSSVLPVEGYEAELRKSERTNNKFFDWQQNVVTVTAYTYAHDWSHESSSFEKETRLVVNIPLIYKPDENTEEDHTNGNYYQIPVCRDKILERNTCYVVSVTINSPGGASPEDPIEIEDVNYNVAAWTDVDINIGDATSHPEFLTLNQYELTMHNIADDNTSISFISSSPITSYNVQSAYYYDKFGQQTYLSGTALSAINLSYDENSMNGKLNIHSPVPTNNAPLYITFTVTNEDGITSKELHVVQYPLEYITNIQGWYSYREDFGGTTYEQRGENGYVGVRYGNNNSKTYSGNPSSDYTWAFRSKVATHNSDGTSSINYFRWRSSGRPNYTYSIYVYDDSYSSLTNLTNARMYHVRITSTSDEYVLGKPKITDGKTDPGADNAKLVSPSFMIASQLGAVISSQFSNVTRAADHCENYVEVSQDKKVYSDWRLPTEAELLIIKKFQSTSGSAIDEVLGGDEYWSASGSVEIKGSGSTYLRCVRDAFDEDK